MDHEKKEEDQIFSELRSDLALEDKGKIIAIDIDARKIIAKDHDKSKVMQDVEKSGQSGRIHIRRISPDGSIHVEIY